MSDFGPPQPPQLPAAGWFPDPDFPDRWRWWDGQAWAASLPQLEDPADRLPPVGDLIGDGFRRVRARWRALGVVAVLTTLVTGVVPSLMLDRLFDGVEIVDGEFVGWSDGRLPVVIALGLVVFVVGLLAAVAGPLLMLEDHDAAVTDGWADSAGISTKSEIRCGLRSVRRSIRVIPRLLGWTLLLGLAAVSVIAVLVLFGLALGPLVILLVLLMIPFFVWAAVKLAFVTVSIVDRRGAPFERSAEVSRGRFWPVVGRLLLIAAIGVGVNTAMSTATAIARGGSPAPMVQFDSGADNTEVNVSFDEFFEVSAPGLVVGFLGSLVTSVLAGGLSSAAFARLYRTRNPAPTAAELG